MINGFGFAFFVCRIKVLIVIKDLFSGLRVSTVDVVVVIRLFKI